MGLVDSSINFIRRVMSQGQQYEMPKIQTYAHYAGGGSFYGAASQEYQMSTFGATYSEFLKMDADLVGRYIDYEDMDDTPLISTCLDIYSDDASQPDHMSKKSLWVECDDEVIREDLDDNLFHRILNVEDRIWGEVRTLCKYGNLFGELVVKDKVGVLAKNNMPQPLVRKVELPLDDYGYQKLGGYMYDQMGSFKLSTNEFIQEMENRMNGVVPDFRRMDPNKTTRVLEDWEVCHMKLMSKKLDSFYGWGIAESARWIFKRLVLLEDSILLHRLTRAPARFAFYIDVSNIPPNEVKGYLNQVKQAIKKKKYINPETNKMDQRYDVLCLSLDTKIKNLDNEDKTLRQMIEDFNNGKENWVYSIDPSTKLIKPGKVSWAGVTRKNASLVKVTLDNGKSEIVTPDHKFLKRDGKYVEAQCLEVGTSLMPCNVYLTNKGNRIEASISHPGLISRSNGWSCIQSVSRMVAENVFGDIDGMHVHHKDRNTLNNSPCNLSVLNEDQHIDEHREELVERGKRIGKSQSSRLIEMNREDWHKKFIINYNNSELHSKHNKIRSRNLASLFENKREEMIIGMKKKFNDSLFQFIIEKVRSNPEISADKLCEAIKDDEWAWKEYCSINSNRKVSKNGIHRGMLRGFLRDRNLDTFNEFKMYAMNNHKVVSVEMLNYTEDTGCITVDEWHNFAVSSGVFVKNSANDDFFLPMRNGQESTRVESLAGAVYDHIEDVKFFENKLFAALKVPKPFLTYEESTAKTNLSAEDARFARTIMRIQREFRNGYKKICNVHLAAKGINPSNVDFTVRMTVPSAIFELAQLEIKQAQLELANNFQTWAPKYWIMTEILGFSDEQIQKMEEMRIREMEPSDGGDIGGGASGSIEKMASKRGKQETPSRSDIKPATPPEPAETPAGPVTAPEWRTQRNTDKYLFDGKSKNMSELKTRIEELKHSDKNFSKKLDRIESYMKDLQSSLRK